MITAKRQHDLTIRIIEYGLEHQIFEFEQMLKDLKIDGGDELKCIRFVLAQNTQEPTPNNIIGIVTYSDIDSPSTIDQYTATFTLLPTAYFSYIDLQEIQLARENSEEARRNAILANKQSLRAIWISILAMLLSTGIGLIQIWLTLK